MTYGVMDLTKSDDILHYRVACDCDAQKCDYTVSIDCDDFIPSLTFSHDMRAENFGLSRWHEPLWKFYAKSFWWRFKTALRVMFLGQIETSSDFILNDNNIQAFKDIIATVQENYKGTHWEKRWISSNTSTSLSEPKSQALPEKTVSNGSKSGSPT